MSCNRVTPVILTDMESHHHLRFLYILVDFVFFFHISGLPLKSFCVHFRVRFYKALSFMESKCAYWLRHMLCIAFFISLVLFCFSHTYMYFFLCFPLFLGCDCVCLCVHLDTYKINTIMFCFTISCQRSSHTRSAKTALALFSINKKNYRGLTL